MKNVVIKKTGVETVVSDEYYEKYSKEGWLIEVYKEPEMVIVKPKAKPKVIKED